MSLTDQQTSAEDAKPTTTGVEEIPISAADELSADAQAEIVEESENDEGIVEGISPATTITTSTNPEKVVNPVTADPYEFDQCTIAVQIVLLPYDGNEHGREVMVGVRNHQDAPIIRVFRMDEIQLPEAITGLLDELRSQLPMRAMEKIQRETKQKEAKKRKPATTTPPARPLTSTLPAPYPTGTMSSTSTAIPVASTTKTGKQPSPGQLDMFNAINQ